MIFKVSDSEFKVFLLPLEFLDEDLIVLSLSFEEVVLISQGADFSGVMRVGDGDGFVPLNLECKLGDFLVVDFDEFVDFSIFLLNDSLNG